MAWQIAGNLIEREDLGDQPDRDYLGPRTGPPEMERERQRRELEAYLQRADTRIVQDAMEQYQRLPPQHKSPIGKVLGPTLPTIAMLQHGVAFLRSPWTWTLLVIRQ